MAEFPVGGGGLLVVLKRYPGLWGLQGGSSPLLFLAGSLIGGGGHVAVGENMWPNVADMVRLCYRMRVTSRSPRRPTANVLTRSTNFGRTRLLG